MQIKSLGFQTNLMFSRYSGSVTDRGSYTLVQTPTNPGYHWGNYIIFDRPPQKGDLKEWTELFNKAFPYYEEPHHYTFAWESDDSADSQEFLEANFEPNSALVLTTEKVKPPPFVNNKIQVRKIKTDAEWESVIELQTLCADPKFFNDYYKEFKRRQMAEYRKMSQEDKGFWFGAFIDGKLVGDLGIFYENDIARYQNVGTHPDYRRKGICGSLVYQTGLIALEEFSVQHLVMEADPEYHAARIYESVGFRRTETNHSLSWWKGKDGNSEQNN